MLDTIDYFLISAFIASIVASSLKKYFSEKASTERLKNSIIQECRLINSSKESTKLVNLNSRKNRVKRVYNLANQPGLNTRGGNIIELVADEENIQKARKIEFIVMKLAMLLKQKEFQATLLKFMFTTGRVALQLLLHLCNINFKYLNIEGELNPQFIIIACYTGGTTGFITSWFSLATILGGPPTVFGLTFLIRSLSQQYLHDRELKKIQQGLLKFLDSQETSMVKTRKNYAHPTFRNLNWNKNPEIKETAEKLGIFKNPPITEPNLNLDLLDTNSEKILEEHGIFKKLKPVKAEAVEPRDFLEQLVHGNNKVDLDFIDVEITREPPIR